MNKMAGITLMFIGSILLISGFVVLKWPAKAGERLKTKEEIDQMVELIIADGVLTRNERETIKKFANAKSLNYDELISDIEYKLKLSGIEAETELIDYSKKNGDEFEKYIVQKFDKKNFRIKEWAGDKYINGQYAETTLQPDILFECEQNGRFSSFAVECKWRKKVYKGAIDFSYPEQLERYRKFEREKKVPVFVAIGQGGKSSDPDHLYIVPLKNITSPHLTLDFLTPYEKDKTKKFYFGPEKVELR